MYSRDARPRIICKERGVAGCGGWSSIIFKGEVGGNWSLPTLPEGDHTKPLPLTPIEGKGSPMPGYIPTNYLGIVTIGILLT